MLAHGTSPRTLVITFLLFPFAILFLEHETREKPASQGEGWEKIGEQKIDVQSESDEVTVSAGRMLQAFKVRSRKGGINLHRCTIIFQDGSKKTVELRNDIPPGGESRAIPISGPHAEVSKLVFRYDTKHYGQPVELEIWGKQ